MAWRWCGVRRAGDMADFSPDHALMVDTALSQQVEILRGPVTLLYSSGNVAGLVDVADGKIPEKCLKTAYRVNSVCV